jgi:CubicO group peptidase (beta-lactamase class C family)
MFMKTSFLSLMTLVLLNVNDAAAQSQFDSWSADENPFSAEGTERIDAFLEDSGSSSALILYQGKVAYQYGDIHEKHLIHSIRKAVLGILYGQLIQDGRVALDERVGDLSLAEVETPFSDREASATVRQLLQSRSGIYLPAAAETARMKESRPARGSHEPGEAYYYNNWSFNALGTLFEARSSKTVYEAFQDQLAEPLGMTSFEGKIGSLVLREEDANRDTLPSSLSDVDGFYLHEPENSRHRAYHFRLSAHDLALFGQLLVEDGLWEGRQLVSKDWIDQVTTCQSVVNENIGGGRSLCYGMMWSVAARDGATISFSHTGEGVHLISVHPGAEMVIVHRAPTEDPNFQRKNHPSGLIGLTFEAFSLGG